ncbi:MAG: RagB/SusD family nutrient uptake outer membrane protein [Bacteroidales bacterium]
MKYIYKLFVLPLVGFMLSACGNDWLDLQPENKIDTDLAIEELSDAEAGIIGIYSALQDYEYYGARMSYYGDVVGDDMQSNSDTKRCASFYRYAYTAENAPRSLWEQPYIVINLANTILASLDHIPVLEGEKSRLNAVKGQALYFRAMAHFDVTKVYGYPYAKDNGASFGAAIVKKPLDYKEKIKRNTVAECYDQLIIPDLIEAATLLSDKKSDAKITKWGAKLLLSRVYLYKGENDKALKEAEECISGAEKAGYSLLSNKDYFSGWMKKYNSESLFEIANLVTDNAGNDGLPFLLWDKGYDDIILTKSFSDILTKDKNDVRNLVTTKGTKKPKNKKYNCYILKCANTVDDDIRSSNVILLRLSEAYLNAAEAAVKTSDNAKAVKYLKEIVERANPANTVKGTVTLTQVLEERRKELFGEGHRAFDLLRNGLPIKRVGSSHSAVLPDYAKTIDWNNYRCVLPIPKYEINANDAIQQNPEW